MAEYIARDKRFIVYELRRPEGTPFYVGKGTGGKRPHRHVTDARRWLDYGNPHKGNIIRKIERDGGLVGIAIVLETDNEQIAFAEEIRRIAVYRADGIDLANITNGGDGMTGPKSAEHRAKIGEAHKGRPRTDAQRAAVAEANRRREHGPETRAKLGAPTERRVAQRDELHAQNIGRKHSDESKAKISAAHKGKTFSEEHRANLSAAHRRRHAQKLENAEESQ